MKTISFLLAMLAVSTSFADDICTDAKPCDNEVCFTVTAEQPDDNGTQGLEARLSWAIDDGYATRAPFDISLDDGKPGDDLKWFVCISSFPEGETHRVGFWMYILTSTGTDTLQGTPRTVVLVDKVNPAAPLNVKLKSRGDVLNDLAPPIGYVDFDQKLIEDRVKRKQ